MHGLPDYYNISNINSETLEIIWNSFFKKLYASYTLLTDENYYIPAGKVFAITGYITIYGNLYIRGEITIYEV